MRSWAWESRIVGIALAIGASAGTFPSGAGAEAGVTELGVVPPLITPKVGAVVITKSVLTFPSGARTVTGATELWDVPSLATGKVEGHWPWPCPRLSLEGQAPVTCATERW